MTRIRRISADILFIFLPGIFFQSCEKELISPIPTAPVEITLNLDFADSDLVPALAAKSITQPRVATDRLGFGGILVVNGSGSNGAISLFAYDLACPHEVDRNIRVIPDNSGKAKCPECGSVYVTMWGTGLPEKNSVSKYPLRSYVVRPTSGSNKFTVLN
ncbi:hypothetical protein FACS189437_03460 [Bacteroidia bacterium]|nr:hypothetical protein FACS189437_03460 [Bacteroidia bacterium]